MTLEELFPTAVEDGLSLETMPTLILEVPIDLLVSAGISINESGWQDAHISGMKFRVDPEREDMKQERHVHVAADRHVRTPNKQVSWNASGSRHDKKNFNTKMGTQRVYRDVARKALGLGSDIVLEAIDSRAKSMIALLEGASEPVTEWRFRARRAKPLRKLSAFMKKD